MGQGGILSEKVFYLTPFDQKGTMVLTGKDQSGTRALENTHLIKANADGSYTLPKDVDKANIYYLVEDYAGNVDYISLAELVRDQNSGRVKIALKDAKTNQDIDTLYVYRMLMLTRQKRFISYSLVIIQQKFSVMIEQN